MTDSPGGKFSVSRQMADGPVTLTVGSVAEAARLLKELVETPPEEKPANKSVFQADPNRARMIAAAEKLQAFRRKRTRYLPPGLLGEPGWDLLLALYTTAHVRRGMPVGELARHCDMPSSSILRWLGSLEITGLITREPVAADRRKTLICLSDRAQDMLDRLFGETT